jgi:peptidoglycan hydrolase-like protein with peptidoglycan-binding domain
MRMFNTDISVIKFSGDIRLDTTLGIRGKRENIRYMFGKPGLDEVTALRFNLSFFHLANPASEEMGTGRGDSFMNVAYDGSKLYFEPDIPSSGMMWEVPSSFMLLRDGMKDTSGQQGLKDILGANPRTVWGQDYSGSIYVLIVEGRRLGQKGLTANELYLMCKQLGLKDAVTADGGGSTVAFTYDTQIGKVWDGRLHGRIMVGYSKYSLNELPVLRKKAIAMQGVYVHLLQRLLGITADGKFSSNTKNAVIDYQRKNNLKVDGIVGQQTWGSLTGGIIGH